MAIKRNELLLTEVEYRWTVFKKGLEKVSFRHRSPGGNVKWAVVYVGLTFRGKGLAGDPDVGVVSA